MSVTIPDSTNTSYVAGPFIDSNGYLFVLSGINTSGSPAVLIHKSIDEGTSWSTIGVVSATDIFGSSNYVYGMAADMDSNNTIHTAVISTTTVRYASFNTSTSTWSSWEDAQTSTGGLTTTYVSIAVDSNNKPHILYTFKVRSKGTDYGYVYYTEKTGSSWTTGVQVNTTSASFSSLDIKIRASNYVVAAYVYQGYVYHREKTSSWQTEGVTAYSATYFDHEILVDTSGTVSYIYGGSNLYETNSLILSSSNCKRAATPTAFSSGGTNYKMAFWVSSVSPYPIKYVRHNGSSWGSATVFENTSDSNANYTHVPNSYLNNHIGTYIPLVLERNTAYSLLYYKVQLGFSAIVTPSILVVKGLSKPPSIPLYGGTVSAKIGSINPSITTGYLDAQAYIGWVHLKNAINAAPVLILPNAVTMKSSVSRSVLCGTWIIPTGLIFKAKSHLPYDQLRVGWAQVEIDISGVTYVYPTPAVFKAGSINPLSVLGSLTLNMGVSPVTSRGIAVDPVIAALFYATLRRWTGTDWAKAKASVYLDGDWQSKPLFVWIDGEWKSVDVSG